MNAERLYLCLARMHHIRSKAKFRRLKDHAVKNKVSGLAKTGKPGVLVFEGRKSCIASFLEAAKGLRYLEFRHVDTREIDDDVGTSLNDAKPGLQEVSDMKTMIYVLDKIGLKDWFRLQMGMAGPG